MGRQGSPSNWVREQEPLPRPSQGCPRGASGPAIYQKSLCIASQVEGVTAEGYRTPCSMLYRKSILGLYRLIMGRLGQEPKVGEGRDQGDMGMSKCGKIVE